MRVGKGSRVYRFRSFGFKVLGVVSAYRSTGLKVLGLNSEPKLSERDLGALKLTHVTHACVQDDWHSAVDKRH